MHTKAVYRAAQALNEAGLITLRFNFRGVGASTGSYEEGIGERGDVTAALDWLEAHYPELPLVAGGFSFGSMVGLSVGAVDERAVGLFGLGNRCGCRGFALLSGGSDRTHDHDDLGQGHGPGAGRGFAFGRYRFVGIGRVCHRVPWHILSR